VSSVWKNLGHFRVQIFVFLFQISLSTYFVSFVSSVFVYVSRNFFFSPGFAVFLSQYSVFVICI